MADSIDKAFDNLMKFLTHKIVITNEITNHFIKLYYLLYGVP